MYRDLLPLGSVVQVAGHEGYVMISGRVVCRAGDSNVYDYLAVDYPFGLSDPNDLTFFMDEAIERVRFIGCSNEVEQAFKDEALSVLDEANSIENVDGQVVIK